MLARAAIEAPAMVADGSPLCGVAAPEATVTGPTFVLEQGYCYTFLGQSLPPVRDVELRLEADPAVLPEALAATVAAGPLLSATGSDRVAMARGVDCYEWRLPVPAPVRLVLRNAGAANGRTGPLAAQAFKRKRP